MKLKIKDIIYLYFYKGYYLFSKFKKKWLLVKTRLFKIIYKVLPLIYKLNFPNI
ncbi:hypothetical protein K449DRAFT_322446 [Hypoxylon sp. EC38]|nr:hypothetical protein K449DRAFT_322446 [Hypoxylon sp. EC38]